MIRSLLLFVLGSLVVGVVALDRHAPGVLTRGAGPDGSVLHLLPPPFPGKQLVRYVLIGADDRPGLPGRSDTLMVLSVNPAIPRAAILSIPRDLYVDIPGHRANKINHAYNYGKAPLTRRTVAALPAIFELIEREGINRVCFYHLVYSGRGRRIAGDALDHAETRRAVDAVFDAAADWLRRGRNVEVLTVDNHADGPYLYLRVLRERGPAAAAEVWSLLRRNGGNNSGLAIGHVDNLGNVHLDQFSWDHTLGNVRQRPFSAIWEDES